MIPLERFDETDPGLIASWTPAVGSLLAAWCVALAACPVVSRSRVGPVGLTVSAVIYVGLVLAISATIGWFAFAAFRPRRRVDIPGAIAWLCSIALWFAPLVLFIARGHLWSAGAAGLFAVAVARLLRKFERTAIDPDRLVRDGGPPVTAAAFAQSGVIAILIGDAGAAAYLIGIGCFLVAWRIQRTEDPIPGFRNSRSRLAVHGILATALTVCGLIPFLGQPANSNTRDQARKVPVPDRASDDLHSGVILLPEKPAHVKIVAPFPESRKSRSNARLKERLSFDFSGEYWFYHWPHRRPPKSSMVTKGTPITFKFTALGRTALSMRATQNLGTFIDFDCCGSIDLTILNSDALPATVGIELILVNTALPGAPVQSLGEMNLTSAPVLPMNRMAVAGRETLRFPFPGKSTIPSFDEIAIAFHLKEPRRGRSAHVAVERFSFIPR